MVYYCDECKKRPATVHITKIHNNKKTELHLCEECARKHQEIPFSFEPNFSIHKFLSGLLEGTPLEVPTLPSIQCPNCRLTYEQFSQIGRFGCSQCYHTFGERLDPLLRKIQGNSRHTGKVPRRAGGNMWIKREVERLRAELQAAVREEAYEKAAEIRDRIRELEQRLK
ncbi:MAG: Putative UvrB/UvrC protein [Thermoanaerobacterales bacterium 50_218]|nr:MAG: Putative UvrB/UvrC protein [Thermoanaerobacterales bacterium 50_218]HAA90615.1 hypothetical protein [Peptococcaceae bacterium]